MQTPAQAAKVFSNKRSPNETMCAPSRNNSPGSSSTWPAPFSAPTNCELPLSRVHDLSVINCVGSLCSQKIDAETTLASTAIWLTALLVCLVLAMNFATGVFLYVKRTRYEAPVVLSPEQKRVLGVKNNGN